MSTGRGLTESGWAIVGASEGFCYGTYSTWDLTTMHHGPALLVGQFEAVRQQTSAKMEDGSSLGDVMAATAIRKTIICPNRTVCVYCTIHSRTWTTNTKRCGLRNGWNLNSEDDLAVSPRLVSSD